MLTTTPAFDTAIKADARKISARVKINYTDAFLDPTITAEPIGTDIITDNVPYPKSDTHTLTDKVTIDCIVRPDFAYDVGSYLCLFHWYLSGAQEVRISYHATSHNIYIIWDEGAQVQLVSSRFDDGSNYININQRIRLTATLDLSSGGISDSIFRVEPLESGNISTDTSWSGTPDVLTSTIIELNTGQQHGGSNQWQGNIEYLNIYDNQLLTADDIDNHTIAKTISYSADELIITEDSQALKTEGNNLVSYPDQAVNGRPETTYKWFSLETDDYVNNMITQTDVDILTEDDKYFELETAYAQPLNKLDGTWHFMPGTEELATFNEVGWWGDNVSASDSSVPGDQGLKVEFSARRVTSFQITGDDKRNEYPVDFSVEFYAGASLEGTENVSSNNLVTYSQNITALDDITSIVLHIDTWSHPYKVPKITEFVTSLFETYTASDIKNFNVIEQREISNDNSVPTGNIASNECDLSLMNNSRKFDAGNTASPLYGLVKPNNKVDIEVGVLTSSGGFEYVPVFTGWTGGWNVPDSDLIASVSARDRLEILRKSYITTSTVIANDTFKDWFTTVLNDAGLAVTEYEIDETLDGSIYTVPYGWFEDVSHREALEILATSCSAAVFVDRNGCIQVKSVDYFETNNLDSVLTYDRSEYMDKSNQPIYENIVNKISVTTQPIEKTTSVTVYQTLSSDKETIAANSTAEYNITYRDKPVSDGVPTIDPAVSGVTVTDSNLYAWGGTVEVTNTNSSSKDFQIKVVGSTYDVAGQKTITAQDVDSINDNGTFFLSYKSNNFLQDTNLAGKIANTLLKSFKDPQRDLTVTFSPGGNPALENDDRISITDLYGTKEYNLVSQRINYDGGLNIEQKGRVVGNVFVLITETGDNIITEDDLFIVLE